VGKLQTGRFERLGARTYSIKGPGALVDLDETVLGVLQLERQAGMESHLMQAWETFAVEGGTGPSTDKYSWVALSNPAGSGRIIVVDGWQRDNATAMHVFLSRGIVAGFSAADGEAPLDTRMSVSHASAANFLSYNTYSSSIGVSIATSASPEFQNRNIVLGPDGTLYFRGSAVTEVLTMSIRWAEREAAPFEVQ